MAVRGAATRALHRIGSEVKVGGQLVLGVGVYVYENQFTARCAPASAAYGACIMVR